MIQYDLGIQFGFRCLQKTNFIKQLDFFGNIGLSPLLIHVVVRSGSLTSLSSFHSLSFYIIKGKTNTSSKKPKIPTTKTPSCLSLPLICLYWQKNVVSFVLPGKLREPKNKFSLCMEENILVVCIWGFLELLFTFHFYHTLQIHNVSLKHYFVPFFLVGKLKTT